MHYRYLTEISDEFRNEKGTINGMSSERGRGLNSLATKLQTALQDLAVAEKALAALVPNTPKGGRVGALMAFHMGAQAKAAPRGHTRPSNSGYYYNNEEYNNTNAPTNRASRTQPADTTGLASGLKDQVAECRATIEELRQRITRQGAVIDGHGCVLWPESDAKVAYDSDLEQKGTQLRIDNGLLYLPNSSRPYDTSGSVTACAGLGWAIYVMSHEGNIHVSSHSVGQRHHSSLLAAARVAGAGELKVTQGRIVMFSNKSGHYKPSVPHLLQTLHQLQKSGVAMDFGLKVYAGGTEQAYTNVGAFLLSLDLLNVQGYELGKLMTYRAHLTDEVLGKHTPPWRWRRADLGETREGVYERDSRTPVPHKEVRTWLKSQGRTAITRTTTGSKGRLVTEDS